MNNHTKTCKICGSESTYLLQKKLLSKYKVSFFRCPQCHFIQTESPTHWLTEAYSSAIASLDIGLIFRNILFLGRTERLIKKHFVGRKGHFLDYAGGYGLFVRLMRDKGYDFYRQDIYCQNLFAEYFDIDDTDNKKFDLVTAFEVFEHLTDPLQEIRQMFEYSESVLFSTELQTPKVEKDLSNWWYFVPETGQHVAIYHQKSLEHIASLLGKNFYTDGKALHLITNKKLPKRCLRLGLMDIWDLWQWNSPKTLRLKDFEMIKGKLKR